MVLVSFLLAGTFLCKERPTVIVNAAKDISVCTLCFWKSSFCLLDPVFGVAVTEYRVMGKVPHVVLEEQIEIQGGLQAG